MNTSVNLRPLHRSYTLQPTPDFCSHSFLDCDHTVSTICWRDDNECRLKQPTILSARTYMKTRQRASAESTMKASTCQCLNTFYSIATATISLIASNFSSTLNEYEKTHPLQNNSLAKPGDSIPGSFANGRFQYPLKKLSHTPQPSAIFRQPQLT